MGSVTLESNEPPVMVTPPWVSLPVHPFCGAGNVPESEAVIGDELGAFVIAGLNVQPPTDAHVKVPVNIVEVAAECAGGAVDAAGSGAAVALSPMDLWALEANPNT